MTRTIAHGRSFLKSNASKSLTVALYGEQFWVKEWRAKDRIPNPALNLCSIHPVLPSTWPSFIQSCIHPVQVQHLSFPAFLQICALSVLLPSCTAFILFYINPVLHSSCPQCPALILSFTSPVLLHASCLSFDLSCIILTCFFDYGTHKFRKNLRVIKSKKCLFNVFNRDLGESFFLPNMWRGTKSIGTVTRIIEAWNDFHDWSSIADACLLCKLTFWLKHCTGRRFRRIRL